MRAVFVGTLLPASLCLALDANAMDTGVMQRSRKGLALFQPSAASSHKAPLAEHRPARALGFGEQWGDLTLLESVSARQERHPFWDFDRESLGKPEVLRCCAMLFFAGLLCSAGGIGGGGVYVTVLMVAGKLSVTDAVPLSKSVVFSGAIASLVLNMKKPAVGKESLIDYNICRLVVPSALIGTYMGVLLNRLLTGQTIVSMLVLILLCMTIMCLRTTLKQYREEVAATSSPENALPGVDGAHAALAGGQPGSEPEPSPGAAHPQHLAESATASVISSSTKTTPPPTSRSILTSKDIVFAIVMLKIVIFCGVFRFHAAKCQAATLGEVPDACHHPVLFFLGDALEHWMRHPTAGGWLRFLSFVSPCFACCVVASYYTRQCVDEGWRLKTALQYELMAVVTGCLAGLVGIGGGLIFSPFFLLMGVEPSVAVATSSTCVIFTSSSTTIQYLLTDRIIMSLTVAYGIVNFVASYAGTSFVHLLQEHFSARRSFISSIVTSGVLVSLVLAGLKLAEA